PRVHASSNTVFSVEFRLPFGLGHRLHSSPAPGTRFVLLCRLPENIIRRSPQQSTPSRLGAGAFASKVPKTLEADRNQLKGEQNMYLNQLTIIGFTGQDADFHFTSNGTPVTTLSVATKESWKDVAGDWQSHTEWHRVVAFGKLAEYAKTLTKG